MSKEIKILTPRIYEHSDFFHNAVDFAREHSLNTNELCLELSHYLVDNFDKVWKIEKPRVYKKLADLEAKLALYVEVIKEREDDLETLFLIRDELEKQLAEQPKQIVDKIKDFVHNNYIYVEETDLRVIKYDLLYKFLDKLLKEMKSE